MPGAIQGQELVFEEKGLSNDGMDTARSEQAGQGSKEMGEKNHQMTHRKMAARRGILRNRGRNNNSPATGPQPRPPELLPDEPLDEALLAPDESQKSKLFLNRSGSSPTNHPAPES